MKKKTAVTNEFKCRSTAIEARSKNRYHAFSCFLSLLLIMARSFLLRLRGRKSIYVKVQKKKKTAAKKFLYYHVFQT